MAVHVGDFEAAFTALEQLLSNPASTSPGLPAMGRNPGVNLPGARGPPKALTAEFLALRRRPGRGEFICRYDHGDVVPPATLERRCRSCVHASLDAASPSACR